MNIFERDCRHVVQCRLYSEWVQLKTLNEERLESKSAGRAREVGGSTDERAC